MRACRAVLLSAVVLAGCHRIGTLRDEVVPPAAAEPAAKPVVVRIASYNVWGLPFAFAEETPSRMKRLPGAVRALEPDLVALQEVWVPSDRRAIVSAFEPDFRAAKSDKGGLLLLSRFPILEERFVPYPKVEGLSPIEALAGKGVLEAIVETPLGPMRVVTTHMVAFDAKVRDEGFPVLAAIVEARRDLPLVLCGDLNVTSVSRSSKSSLTASYRRLLDLACVDCLPPRREDDGRYDSGPNTHVGWPREDGGLGWWRPDHVFYRSGETLDVELGGAHMAFDTPETALSDHNLLFAELRLVPRTSAKR